jgi:hypothetical protein
MDVGGEIMKLGAGFVGILLIGSTLPASAGERMIMKVSPAVAFAPANLIVRAYVEADADNRAIAVIAESEDFYRSSEIQLDGDHAADQQFRVPQPSARKLQREGHADGPGQRTARDAAAAGQRHGEWRRPLNRSPGASL